MTAVRPSTFHHAGPIQPRFSGLFFITCLLFAFGLLMMTSASIEIASSQYQDPFYFLKRQGIFSLIGFAVIVLTLHIPLSVWKKLSGFLLIVSGGLLVNKQ